MLSSTAGEPVPFVPLAFADGQETTAFFMIVPNANHFHFILYKKDKIDDAIAKNKSWKNLGFAILESTKFDIELFDNPRAAYLDWLKANSNDVKDSNEDLENRRCYYIDVETCYYPGGQASNDEDETEDLETRYDPYCKTTTEWICPSVSDGCTGCSDEETGGGGDGSGNGSGAASNFNEDDYINYVSGMVGGLTSSQQNWLRTHSSTLYALGEIGQNSSWSDRQKADAIFDHFTKDADPILTAIQMAQEVAYLKAKNPGWSSARVVFTAAWNVTSGTLHTVLDLVGLVPALGEGADFVNGVFYLLEGDNSNAVYSFAAMVPFAGWTITGAKAAGLVIKASMGTGRAMTLTLKKLSNGGIDFGKSGSQLASAIGSKSGHQAHHIIPWAQRNHRLSQIAGHSKEWHPNLAGNGINLSLTVHNGHDQAHRIYSARVIEAMDDILDKAGNNISPQDAAKALKGLADDIRVQLNQGKKLDEITF